MYYHGQEPRHLHYHPLEAMVIGLPVIFHTGSLLATAYLPQSPGICGSYGEINAKLKRLEEGDHQLRDAIIAYQDTIVDKLRVSNNMSIFDRLLEDVVM